MADTLTRLEKQAGGPTNRQTDRQTGFDASDDPFAALSFSFPALRLFWSELKAVNSERKRERETDKRERQGPPPPLLLHADSANIVK